MFTRSLGPVVVQISHIGRHIGPRHESTGTPVKNRSRFTITVLRMSSECFSNCAGFCAKQCRRGGHRLDTTPGGRSN